MTSVVFSVFLLLQTISSAATMIGGRLTVEGSAQSPSSFTLPLTLVGAQIAPALPVNANRSIIIRPQIDGTFRVQLPAGEYRLGAPARLPPGYTIQSMKYAGVDLLMNPFTVPSGDSSELLITLATTGPSPAVSVSGRVTGITPGQVERIALRESSGGELSAALETNIGADGSFTFPKVLPGSYIVYMTLLATTPVTVGTTNVTGVIVANPQAILVAGHVIAEGAQSIPAGVVIEGNGKAASMQARANGTFILSLEKGENTIVVRSMPETHRLKSMTYGDVDLQKQPLKLDGPANWDIVVRIEPKN